MHYPYPEFEKVMKQCSDIFMTWGDEYEKINALIRESMRRNNNTKVVWRAQVGAGHKALQARMESMKKYGFIYYVLQWVVLKCLFNTDSDGDISNFAR
jgi:dynein heavy chain 1